MLEPYWTDWIIGLTLPASGWLALWSSFVGIFIAYFVGRHFEQRRERMAKRQARRAMERSLSNLQRDLKPYSEWDQLPSSQPTVEQGEMAALAIVQARASLIWAANNPQLFNFSDWIALHEAEQVITSWLQARKSAAPFLASLFRGEVLHPAYISRLAWDIDSVFGPPWTE